MPKSTPIFREAGTHSVTVASCDAAIRSAADNVDAVPLSLSPLITNTRAATWGVWGFARQDQWHRDGIRDRLAPCHLLVPAEVSRFGRVSIPQSPLMTATWSGEVPLRTTISRGSTLCRIATVVVAASIALAPEMLFAQASTAATRGDDALRREPVNDAEVQMQNKYLDRISPQRYERWVRHVLSRPAGEQAWLRTLEDQLGSFYFPPYLGEVVSGTLDRRQDAWAYVEDDPRLPRVLIIGDSISRSYTAAVRHALEGRANVHRAPANCGRTEYFFKNGEVWLEQNGSSKWDVITVNFGIHDHGKKPDEYAANLRRIIARLRETGATILWVRTTPWGKQDEGDISLKTNPTSDRVAAEEGLEVVDLHAVVADERDHLQTADRVHFTAEGAEKLGVRLADVVGKHLGTRATAP